MASAEEITAVKSADLGAWLASIGLAGVLGAMEEVGAEAPHDLMYLEQEDIDSLGLGPTQQQGLKEAIARIEDIEDGRVAEPEPAAVASPPHAPAAAAHEPEHGHILRLHHEEMERERKKAEAEAEARAALEREVQELKQQIQGAFAQAKAAEEQLKATAESTRRQLDELSSKNRQLEAEKLSAAPPAGSAADAAARQAAEAKAERLAAQLREAQDRPAPEPGAAAPSEPLAVVGLACRFAAADNIVEFWDNLEAGRDCVTVGPRGRWNVDDFFDPDQDAPGKTYSHWGGFIDDVDLFEPAFFGISARETHSMDPQQRLFLECAWEAMEDAGVVPETLKDDPVGVFLGIQNYDYYRLIGIAGHADEMDAYFGTGNSHSCAVGRLSFILGIKGPSVPVDTACSSSLVAMHLAVQSLRSGESDLAFAAGVNMMLAPEINVNLCKAHMLSPDGRCHTYSADANGYVRAEGCGVTLLKPLKEALKNNDRIHAQVIGSAVNHDGASSGLTVPSGPAQTQVISAAQQSANITPDDVSNIESHGTGTKLGDPIEITSLCSVFEGRKPDRPLVVGTVKTNIGHGESAAGIAGITKAVLSLEKGRIPKHLHMTELNPFISFQDVPVLIPQETMPWPSMFNRRITGCSAFGFGGTNGHVCLEDAPPPPPVGGSEQEWHLFTVSARTAASLTAYTAKLSKFVEGGNDLPRLADLCYTSTLRTQFPFRLALSVNSMHSLKEQLRVAAASSGQSAAKSDNGDRKVAFEFPDSGPDSAYTGMGEQLYATQPVFKAELDACDELLGRQLGKPLKDVLFLAGGMANPQHAAPALFAYQYALSQLWQSWGVSPAVVAGHGVGEFVAGVIAGIFSLADGLKMVMMRAQLLANDPTWAMGGNMFGMVANMVSYSAPTIPFVSSKTGQVDNSAVSTGDYWKDQPLYKMDVPTAIAAAKTLGADVFAQVGPAVAHAAAGKQALGADAGASWLATMDQSMPEGRCSLEMAAGLMQLNVAVDSQAVCSYDPTEHRVVWMPTYAFDRKSFWLEVDRDVYAGEAGTGSGSGVGGQKITPLLGVALKSPMSQEVFHTEFSTNNLPLLGDHVLHDVVVVPGAAYISFGLSAACHMHGQPGGQLGGPHRLHSVTFPQALVLPEAETGREVQLIFDDDSNETSFALYSLDKHTDEWVNHMTGSLSVRPDDAPEPMMEGGPDYLANAQARCNMGEMPTGKDNLFGGVGDGVWCEELYDILWKREYQLRPMFRWLGHIWKGDREAICEMRMPMGEHETEGFQLFPGLIDSCFQLLAATAFDEFQGTTFIPMWADAYNYFGRPPPGTQLYCHAIERKNSDVATKDAMGADLWLFDAEGNKYVELVNIRMKKAGVEALIHSALERPTNNQFFDVAWKAASVPTELGTKMSWMVMGDTASAGVRTVSSYLTERGHSVVNVAFGASFGGSGCLYTVDPCNPEDFKKLVASVPACDGVLHAGAMNGLGSLDPTSALAYGTQSAFFLAQALATAPWTCRLYLATCEAQKVGSSSVRDVNSSTIWGLGRVLALEFPAMKATVVDLEQSDPAAASALGREILGDDSETQVAYRGGRRVTGRLAQLSIPKEDGGANPIKLQVNGRGKLDNLSYQPFDRAAPQEGEIEIRVAVTGLNFRDVMNAMGMYPDAEKLNMPFGGECAGYVARLGPGVTEFNVGDEVFGIGEASMATYAISDVNYVVRKPPGISFEEATTIPATFLTAWYGLVNLANVGAGKKVLVHAASGGVGLAAVQVCKCFGCEVFGTAKPGEKQEYLRANGVTHVMSSRDTAYGDEIAKITNGGGVDVVLNSLSGEGMIEKSIRSLSQGGHFVEIGKAGIWTAEQVRAIRPDVHFHHFDLVAIWNENPPFIKSMLGDLMDRFSRAEIQTLPVQSFPQSRTVDAFRFMANAKHIGKIVVQWDPPVEPVAFKSDASYLVTGGLSGVGFLTAKWMISKGAKHIVLASRSGATDANLPMRKELEELGADTVTAVALDASDTVGVKRVVAELAVASNPLRGVIHSAGIVDDHLVVDTTWEQFTKVMKPKLNAAWNLHLATENVPLDFFVLYSTMSAVVGNVGQANYAAGNAFMDALCQMRHAKGMPALSINWGPWAEVGMASRMDAAALQMIPEKAMISPDEGMQLLEQLMSGNPCRAQAGVVSTTFLQSFASSSALMVDMLKELKPIKQAAAAAPTKAGGSSALKDTLQATPEDARKDTLVEFVSGEVAKILALDGASDVDPTQPLTEMGLDSLMAVELRNALADAVATPLPATLLFDYPFVVAIAEFLMKDILVFSEGSGSAPAAGASKPKKKAVKKTAVDDAPIAVIGMSCRFPAGGDSPELFWDNLVAEKDCVKLIPSRRWDWKEYYHANMDTPGKTYSKWAACLEQDADLFDPFFFGIVPKEASGMDPQQRQLIECAWETMERSGYHIEPTLGSPVGVYIGICSNDYQMAQTATGDKKLCDAYYGTGNANSVAAGRLAYVLGFQGPTISVDTACSSSVVATHLAVAGIRTNECEMALAGGVNMLLTPDLSINFSKAHMLSPDGRCFTFDARANGYVRGEGCGMNLLKPLADAQEASDNIVACIRGSAVNQDGRSSGITAPNGPSQQACIRLALQRGSVSPSEVGYLEAHGTGTPLGDPIEVDAMAAVFGREGNFHLGSVKTNIGHLEGSAGASGLAKLILACKNAQLPAHLHFKTENPHLSLKAANATLPLKTMPWPDTGSSRIGGVSSFGFSGTNGHIVVEQPPASTPLKTSTDRTEHLFTMSAKTEAALKDLAKLYAAHFEAHPDQSLSDICFTASTGRATMAYRAAVSVSSLQQLQSEVAAYAANDDSQVTTGFVEEKVAPKTAFVFAGQGTSMGKQLYDTNGVFRENVDACDKLSPGVKASLFAGGGAFVEGAALFTFEYALAQTWMSWGVKPAVVMGNGVGEFVAACVAGVFSLEDGLKLVAVHSAAVGAAAPVKMVSVAASEFDIMAAIKSSPGVAVSGTNGPTTTLSGQGTALDGCVAMLRSQGVRCVELPTPAAFVAPAAAPSPEVQSVLSSMTFSKPRIALMSNNDGTKADPDGVASPDYWRTHVRPSTHFATSLKSAFEADKCRIFIEMGTQGATMTLASRLLQDDSVLMVPSLTGTTTGEWTAIQSSLAKLFVRGAAVDFAGLHSGYGCRRVILPTYPFQRQRFWVSGLGGSLEAVSDSHALQSVNYGVSPVNKALGRLVSTPFAQDTIFLSHFSCDTMPVIEDHIINGFLIVPAVFDVGMVLEAHNYLHGPGSRVLEGVQIPAALVLNDIASKPTQLVINEVSETQLEWQLFSYKSGDPEDPNSWLGNASGKMSTDTTNTTRTNETIEQIQARCTTYQNRQDFYEYMFKNEYELGGPLILDPKNSGGLPGSHKSGVGNGFQLVNQIWRTNSEALCELIIEPQSVRGEFEFYPVYFDCCIQIIASIVSSLVGEESVSYVPIAIEKFILHHPPVGDQKLYCHTVLQDDGRDAPGDWLAKDTIPAMMCVMAADGDVIAEAINFRVKRAGKELLANSLKEDLSHYYYNLDWTEAANEADSADPDGSWLVLADSAVAPAVSAELAGKSQTVVTVRPGATFSVTGLNATVRPDVAEDFEQLLAHDVWKTIPACVGVVHMWSLDGSVVADPSPAELDAATTVGTHSALLLSQALSGWDASPRVWLVTRGTQATPGDEGGLAYAQSPLFGFGKVLALERPKMQCVRIDLGLTPGAMEVQQLMDELMAQPVEQEVALRGDDRFVSRIVQRPKDKSGTISLSPEGSYLITGGFGALGLLVAKLLAERGAKHLVLVSRRGAPEGSEEALDELKELGATVTVGKADASKEDQMRALFDNAKAAGHPIVGAIHSAGVIDDKMLMDLDWASFEKVMAAKVAGARNLHMLMQDPSHEFCVFFSSATSAIGNVGQANYAAANMFLDSLAKHRRASGLPGLSINWGPWSEVGMAAALDAKTFEAGGLGLIAPKKGMEILEQCMVQETHPQVVISLVTWATFLGRMGKNVPALFTVMKEANASSGGGGGGGSKKKKKAGGAGGGSAAAEALIKRLLAVPEAKRQPVLSGMIQASVMEVLGVTDPSAVGLKQALSEVGMDSLMAVEVQNVLAEMVGATLPGTLLFDYPTIDAISTFFLDEVLDLADEDEGGGGGMSQEQLDKMRGEPIAVVGTSCRMPGGGNDCESFWDNLEAGVISTGKVPGDRWDHNVMYSTDQDIPGKVYTDQGGFLDFNPVWFDAGFFGISNREAEHMDPQQRMVLTVVWEAMESAGVNPETLVGSRTGVNIGVCGYDYCLLGTRTNDLAGIVGYTGTGVAWSVLAGRTSYTYGLKGPAFAVDTACSSGLIATHLACNDLKSGVTNNAVAGGVNLLLAPDLYVNFSKAHMLSPNGRCATFDETADGFCRAEGCSMLLLKRLSDAETAGDRIQGLIKGTSTNQDGRSNSLTAPNGPSQQAVIQESLMAANVEPAQVSYMECHGTGTSLGDPIEVIALGNVLGTDRAKDGRPLIIGSVKAAIGHLEGAAGSSGLAKILMCMKYEKIPPQVHYFKMNDMITIDQIPAIIPLGKHDYRDYQGKGYGDDPTPWETDDKRLIADVSSFGFGGSNAHATLEKYRPKDLEPSKTARPIHVLPLSAPSEEALKEIAGKYLAYCNGGMNNGVNLEELEHTCFTAGTGRQHFPVRVAIPCANYAEACEGLEAYASGRSSMKIAANTVVGDVGVVMMFTGQGSQYAGMGKELYDTQPVFKEAMDECAKILKPLLKVPLLSVLYPREGETSPIDETAYTQPALFAFEYCLAQLWASWGVEAAAVMGHSVGEYVAACIAGVFSLEDGLKLIATRARLMDSVQEKGSMAAVFASPTVVEQAIAAQPDVGIAAINGPGACVISGKAAGVAAVLAAFKAQNVRATELNTSNAFHSAVMDPILDEFEKVAKKVTYGEPYTTIILNRTGKPADKPLDAAYWRDHLRNAVLFSDSVQNAFDTGSRIFLEVGPNPVLLGMARRIVSDDTVKWISSLKKSPAGEYAAIAKAVADLYAAGAEFSWAGWDKSFSRKKVLLPSYAFQQKFLWPKRMQIGKEMIDNEVTNQTAVGGGGAARSRGAAVTKAAPASTVYDSVWRSVPCVAGGKVSGTWLVLSDTLGIGDMVAQLARESGAAVTVVPPTVNAAQAVASAGAVTTVVDLRSAGMSMEATIATDAVASCSGAVDLVRALTAANLDPKIWFATCGAQPVLPGAVALAQAPLWGLARVVSLEAAQLWGGLVDLDPADSASAQATKLLTEITSPSIEDHVAYRGADSRYVLRVAPSKPITKRQPTLKADSAYLVTGGLGGVLQQISRWMVANGAKHLILTSRRGLLGANQQQQEFVKELQDSGVTVEVVAVDVCDLEAMRAVISSAPIAGIVHGAGVMTMETLETLATPELAKVLAPKVQGSLNLHSLSAGLPLDFFVMFSSISAVWGSNQLAHYAAANIFCDALAHHRRSLGLTALSVNWGLLAEGGMSAHEDAKFAEAMGLRPLTVAEYTTTMGDLISADTTQKVAVGIEFEKFKDVYEMRGVKPLLTEVGSKSDGAQSAQGAFLKEKFGDLAADADKMVAAMRALTLEAVHDTVGEIDIDFDAPLMESGMDSMMAVDFRNALQEKLGGLKLSQTLMFDYPTLGKVAEYLVKSVSAVDMSAAAAAPVPVRNGDVAYADDSSVAIVGMAGVLPDAPSVEGFWDSLTNAKDAIREIPWERFDVAEYFDADKDATGNKIYVSEGGFIANAEAFDNHFFDISAAEASLIDPQQRLLLDIGTSALYNAGFSKQTLKEASMGVYCGVGSPDFRDLSARDQALIGAFSATGSALCICANRISYALGLKGPSIALDTACSSALTATSLGHQALLQHNCDGALAEGVNLLLAPTTFVATCKARMLSPNSRCRTFDAGADGYVRGEGCGAIVMVRSSDVTSEQNVLATIQATALNQDGRTATLTAPNGPSQQDVISSALQMASISGADINYLETHGTGTPLGDPIEVGALQSVLGVGRDQPLILGAVKTNIGHLEAAAGIASIIKSVLVLQNQTVPPNLHFTKLNPVIDAESYVNFTPKMEALPEDALSGVSSFGFGGTNAHVILQAADTAAQVSASHAATPAYERKLFRWEEVTHPLVGVCPKLAAADATTEWTTTWDAKTVETLCGHRVGRVSLVPATCYIEMVTPIVRQLHGDTPFSLQNLQFVNILYLSVGKTPTVRVSLTEGTAIKIESLTESTGQWTLHASMNLQMEPTGNDHPKLDIAAVKARCPEVRPGGEEFYTKIGNDYQGHFRSVSEIFLGDDELLCCVEIDPSTLQGRPDLCAMAWLDACTQAGVTRMDHQGRPFYAAKAGVYEVGGTDRRLQSRLWSVMKQAVPGGREGRIDIYNDVGEWMVSIVGNEAGFFERGAEPTSLSTDCMYETKWELLQGGSASTASSTWLVVGDGTTAQEACKALAGSVNAKACTAGALGDAVALEPDATIVCISALTPGAGRMDVADLALTAVKAAGKMQPVWLVTRGTQPVLDVAEVKTMDDAQHSGLWGLGRTARAEARPVRCIDVAAGSATVADVARQLLACVTAPDAEMELAVRGGQLYVPRLTNSEVKLSGPVELYMPARGSLSGLVTRPLSAASRVAPGPGEVEVRVRGTGLNFRDVLNAMGLYPGTKVGPVTADTYKEPGDPGPIGGDCAGVVVAVGEGVDHITVGDQVLGIEGGSLKSYVTGPAHLMTKKPANLSFAEAASMPIIWITVELAFSDPFNPGVVSQYNLKKGESVLIHAATGGVGLVAVAYAQRVGAIVYATAGKKEKHDHLRAMGVQYITSSRDVAVFKKDMDAWTAQNGGIDVCLNCLADDFIPESLALLKNGGRFMEIGKRTIWTKEQMAAARPDVLYEPIAADVMLTTNPKWFHGQMTRMVQQLETGIVKPIGIKEFDMEKSGIDALRFLQQAQHIGKVVVTQPSTMGLQTMAAYVITGGMGALGLAMARRMVEEGACNLVLLSRSGAPTAALEPQWQWLQRCSANVLSRKCDVSSKTAVNKVFGALKRSGIVVRGVIHAAGVLDDATLDSQDRAKFEKVYGAKVDGAWNLHNATQGMPLDFFVLFSSISALLGSTAQANYSAANSALDGLANYRRSIGLAASSVQWGAWAEAGMAAEKDTLKRLEARGMDGLSTELGLTAMSSLLAAGSSQSAVTAVMPVRWPKFLEQFGGSPPPFLAGMAAAAQDSAGGAGAAATGGLISELQALPLSERTTELSEIIVSLAAEVMGRASISVDEPLMDAGMDSLGAVEFRNALAAKMGGMTLPDTMMYDFPTIGGIAGYIAEELGDSDGAAAPGAGSSSTVLQLSSGSGSPAAVPIFCVQGAGRGDYLYKDVSKQLGEDQPFYELRFSGKDFNYTSVTELAQYFAGEIKKIAPRGTVTIAGWSFGGLVAYEIARQLSSSGTSGGPRVGSLVLIDWVERGMAVAGGHDPQIGAVGALVRSVELRVGRKLPAAALDTAVSAVAGLPLDGKVGAAIALLEEHGLLSGTDDATKAELTESVIGFEHAISCLMAHTGPTSAAEVGAWSAQSKVKILALSSSAFGLHQMERYAWAAAQQSAGHVEVATIDGDHWEVLRKPGVTLLADKISTFLTVSPADATVAVATTMANDELKDLISSLQAELQRR